MDESALLDGVIEMNEHIIKRRSFLQATAAGTAVIGLAGPSLIASGATGTPPKPALLGGTPIRQTPFPSWPIIEKNDEEAWMEVLRSKHWCRLGQKSVEAFEREFAKRTGSK